jgi:hypothetical protein
MAKATAAAKVATPSKAAPSKQTEAGEPVRLKDGRIHIPPIAYDAKAKYPPTKSGWADVVYDTERYVKVEGSDTLRAKITIVNVGKK